LPIAAVPKTGSATYTETPPSLKVADRMSPLGPMLTTCVLQQVVSFLGTPDGLPT
jgi:hypothetical protein